jgi:hypothetical protein
MLSDIFDEIVYCGGHSASLNLKKILPNLPSHIQMCEIPVLNYAHTFFKSVIRRIAIVLINCWLLVRAEKEALVFYNNNELWAVMPLNWINKIVKKNVIIVCHGEMEKLQKQEKSDLLTRKAVNFCLSPKTKIAEKLYFCVLGESILQNILKVVPSNVAKHFLTFEHTYIFRTQVNHTVNLDDHLQIGKIGVAHNKKKDFKALLYIGKELQKTPDISIKCIGRVWCDISLLDEIGISYIKNADKGPIDRSVMNDEISQLDYALLLYPEDSYKFTASGAIYDAIDNEIPILAIRNDYFDYLFRHRAVVGHLFKNVEEIVDFLINKAKDSLKREIFDYREIKKRLSPEFEAQKFEQTLITCGIISK